jgi:hypothetical protein
MGAGIIQRGLCVRKERDRKILLPEDCTTRTCACGEGTVEWVPQDYDEIQILPSSQWANKATGYFRRPRIHPALPLITV